MLSVNVVSKDLQGIYDWLIDKAREIRSEEDEDVVMAQLSVKLEDLKTYINTINTYKQSFSSLSAYAQWLQDTIKDIQAAQTAMQMQSKPRNVMADLMDAGNNTVTSLL